MFSELNNPMAFYEEILSEIDKVLSNINQDSSDKKLQDINIQAKENLNSLKEKLKNDIQIVQKNSEWKKFTIAFYGETNAGKSTIIETLRIILNEKTKLSQQKAFREFQNQHNLTNDDIENLRNAIDKNKQKIDELSNQINNITKEFNQKDDDIQNEIEKLNEKIKAKRKNFSFWDKFIHLWKQTAEEKEKESKIENKKALNREHKKTIESLENEKLTYDEESVSLNKTLQLQNTNLEELRKLADGEIIGTGKSDFTMDTTEYLFEHQDQSFSLLDVPGIEGKENKVLSQIEQAVQKAHAIFYVTSKAAAPQKGDEKSLGTLDKIKLHLNNQTEVWTLFNKRITNSIQLERPDLITGDEQISLNELNTQMKNQLGDNYCNTYSVSALPAFLSVADHLAPNTENMKKRNKFLDKLTKEDILEKSGFNGLISLLTNQLVINSKEKIKKSNFKKVKSSIEMALNDIQKLQENCNEQEKRLKQTTDTTLHEIDRATNNLKSMLSSKISSKIEFIKGLAQEDIYEKIDSDISNDEFKSKLKRVITEKHDDLEKDMPDVLEQVLNKFKENIENEVKDFERNINNIQSTYSKLLEQKMIDSDISKSLEFNLKSGVNTLGLISTLLGGSLLILNPVGWLILVPALASLVFSFYKAIRSFFSSSYKKSQQRESADKNINMIFRKTEDGINDKISEILPELKTNMEKLKSSLKEPYERIVQINKILSNTINELRKLSEKLN